jgi:hypothetical protein
MLRARMGLLFVIATVAAITGDAQADDSIYYPYRARYNSCRQQEKSARYCETLRDRYQDDFHCMGNGRH